MLSVDDFVTAQGFDNIGASALGIVCATAFGACGWLSVAGMVIVSCPNGFVDNVDVFQVGELFGDGVKPFGNVLFSEFDGNSGVLFFCKENLDIGNPKSEREI